MKHIFEFQCLSSGFHYAFRDESSYVFFLSDVSIKFDSFDTQNLVFFGKARLTIQS